MATAPEEVAAALAADLRRRGCVVGVGATVTFAEALAAVGGRRRSLAYWAGRATLVRRQEDVPAFDAAFTAVFGGPVAAPPPPPHVEHITLAVDDEEEDGADDAAGEPVPELAGPTLQVRWSAHEVLRHKDFASYSDEEFDEARRLMADLRLAGAVRRSRRQQPSRHRTDRLDLRRTVAGAVRTEGEVVRRRHRQPGTRPRRVVLLLDVSGSMEPYARALARFLHAAVVGRGGVEAFALGTRLTRLTRELSSHDPDAALARAGRAVADWSGGTRLGDGLRRFNDEWGVRGMARGAVVVILSDGWDRGDPAVLGTEVQRLARVAHRVVWVNPLKASAGYAPLARGMAAALPYVDEFVEGHSLATLEALVEVVGR